MVLPKKSIRMLAGPVSPVLAGLLLSSCTIVKIEGASPKTSVGLGILRIVPESGSRVLVYRSTGLGLVPSLNGAVLGYSDQQAALIYDRDDCRVLILSMPKPEVERAELLKLLKDRPDICVAGEKGDDRKTTGNIGRSDADGGVRAP